MSCPDCAGSGLLADAIDLERLGRGARPLTEDELGCLDDARCFLCGGLGDVDAWARELSRAA